MAHWPKCILTGLHRIWHDIQSDSSRQGHLICALIVLSAPVSRETSLLFPAGPATNIRLVIQQTTFDGTLHLNAKSALYIYISLARQRGRDTGGEELPWVGERECDWSQLPDLTQSELCRPSHLRSHPFPIHPRVILQRVNQQLLNSDPTPHPSVSTTLPSILYQISLDWCQACNIIFRQGFFSYWETNSLSLSPDNANTKIF